MANSDDFRASDLIGPAGVGSNGERLVATLADHYPPELQAAQLKRINPRLDELDDKQRKSAAKIAGVDELQSLHVRGGERRESDAVVTYAYLDDDGQVWKGCFPYSDLGSGSSDSHVSQRASLNEGTAGREFLANREAERKSERSSKRRGADSADSGDDGDSQS